uniref:Uncharacterized protein n=1 Tax=Arundo donax TaxID=35708 RepID=A0A0A9HES5_ARUDO
MFSSVFAKRWISFIILLLPESGLPSGTGCV